jgi:hypothetical protein
MSANLIINFAIIIFPLMLSSEKQIQFYKKITRLFTVFFTIGVTSILCDIIASGMGDLSFGRQYVGNTSLFGLPIEEIFLFVTVFYSTMFTFEVSSTIYLRKLQIEPTHFLLSLCNNRSNRTCIDKDSLYFNCAFSGFSHSVRVGKMLLEAYLVIY